VSVPNRTDLAIDKHAVSVTAFGRKFTVSTVCPSLDGKTTEVLVACAEKDGKRERLATSNLTEVSHFLQAYGIPKHTVDDLINEARGIEFQMLDFANCSASQMVARCTDMLDHMVKLVTILEQQRSLIDSMDLPERCRKKVDQDRLLVRHVRKVLKI